MKHIKYFEEKAIYDSYINGNEAILPNVSYTVDTNEVFYNSSSNNSTKNYMYVEALEDDTLVSFKGLDLNSDSFYIDPYNTLEYSVDQQTWNAISTDGTATTINTGEKLYFRGECTDIRLDNDSGTGGIGIFLLTKKYNVGGNIMSLLFSDNFEDKIDLTGYDYVFVQLFVDIMTIANGDEGKLVSAENLLLPATTLARNCYSAMFGYCTSLQTAPSTLPATTLTEYCYYNMFLYCTSLTSTPQLPATILASLCYGSMFNKCTSLTSTPSLPATTLADNCYSGMFQNCTSLVNAPELPATTLADSCYIYMFENCTSLENAPELPATTLVYECYAFMFYGCSSLITAPKLPATILIKECYEYMFSGCTSLQEITMLATDIPASDCLYNWVKNVASTGTFTKHPDMTSLSTGTSGIPSGWTVVDYEIIS